MKALILSTDDILPGASLGAYRLHKSWQNIGIDSQMLVQTKRIDDSSVIGRPDKSGIGNALTGLRLTTSQLPLKLYPKRDRAQYSTQWLPDGLANKVAQLDPDVISLHWICSGFLQIETLAKFKKPLFWTLRDMWAFTGGCHYSGDCDRYMQSCGACPQLASSNNWDLSRITWERKARAWKNLDLTIVALSSWVGKCASKSSLFRDLRIEVIPNGLDKEKYRASDRTVARDLLSLPQDKQLVFFGAVGATSSKRKGFHLLQPALQKLSQSGWQDKLELVVFGASQPDNPPEFGFKVHYLGTFSGDLPLSIIYSAADVFICPSIEDNLPNTVMESTFCGTPCVGFNIGGIPDIIEHQQNGYLVKPYEIDDLARGIAWILENETRYQKLAHRAREKAITEFTSEMTAQRYLTLFNEILEKNKSKK